MVTIAIPIYNAEQYLRAAIQSCINQTYQDWELLLMCDGSTDSSNAIAHEMAVLDKRIRVYDDGCNHGLISRLNQSIYLAQGKFYARMDADDIMYITRIEEQVKYLEDHPEVDVVGTSIMTIDNNNNIVGSGLCSGNVSEFVHPTVMGRTVWFWNHPYSEWALRAEDTELWIRTASNSSFHAIGKPLFFYREFGIPTFKKYYLSQKTLLRIFYRYKEYEKSFGWFVKNSIITLGKIIIYALFLVIGKTDVIIKLRRRRFIPKEYWLTKEDLERCIENKKI